VEIVRNGRLQCSDWAIGTLHFFEELLATRMIRQPFDWIGCPMWSICELLKNDFKDFTAREKLKPLKRFIGDHKDYLTHTDYNIVFVHDYGKQFHHISDETHKKVSEDYVRRVERWNTLLASNTHVLFIRLETDGRKRIQRPQFDRPGAEYDYLKEFSQILQAKGVKFSIVYLSTTTPRGYDAENHIVTVQYATVSPDYIVGGDEIKSIIQNNIGFIAKYLFDEAKAYGSAPMINA
jgi:hypothetical protein